MSHEHLIGEVRSLAVLCCERFPQLGDPYEAFLRWGHGWIETPTFILHGYRYDDSCICGARNLSADDAALVGLTTDDERLMSLLCCCADGSSGLMDIAAVEQPAEFVHRTSGFEMSWYKHPGRGNRVSAQPSMLEMRRKVDECVTSLEEEGFIAVVRGAGDAWPVDQMRRSRHESRVLSRWRSALEVDRNAWIEAVEREFAAWDPPEDD